MWLELAPLRMFEEAELVAGRRQALRSAEGRSAQNGSPRGSAEGSLLGASQASQGSGMAVGVKAEDVAKVGVISDTHDNLSAIEKALEGFEQRGARTLVHAGDIIAPFSLRRFLSRGFEFRGVFGNNDGELLLLSKVAQEHGATLVHQPLVLQLGGLHVLVMHGIPSLQETKTLIERLALGGVFDVIIYGHTHEVDVRRVGGTLIINPGEACGYLTGKRTAAVLDTGTLEVEIMEI